MYDNANYAAKERAAQTQAAIGTGAGIAANTLSPDRAPTFTEVLIRELESACNLLSETAQIQEAQHERLYGPRPTDPNAGKAQVSAASATGLVEERLMWLRGLTQRVYQNACEFNRVV